MGQQLSTGQRRVAWWLRLVVVALLIAPSASAQAGESSRAAATSHTLDASLAAAAAATAQDAADPLVLCELYSDWAAKLGTKLRNKRRALRTATAGRQRLRREIRVTRDRLARVRKRAKSSCREAHGG